MQFQNISQIWEVVYRLLGKIYDHIEGMIKKNRVDFEYLNFLTDFSQNIIDLLENGNYKEII